MSSSPVNGPAVYPPTSISAACSTGSVKLLRLNYYSGDVSTMKLHDSSYGRVARGGPGSSNSRIVSSHLDRRPQLGDTYCLSGVMTDEMCASAGRDQCLGQVRRRDQGLPQRYVHQGR